MDGQYGWLNSIAQLNLHSGMSTSTALDSPTERWLRKCRQKRWSITRFKLIFLHILQPAQHSSSSSARPGTAEDSTQTNQQMLAHRPRRRLRRITESRLSIWSTHRITQRHTNRDTQTETQTETHTDTLTRMHTYTHTHAHTSHHLLTTNSTKHPPLLLPPSTSLSLSRNSKESSTVDEHPQKPRPEKTWALQKNAPKKHVNCFCSVWARTLLFLLRRDPQVVWIFRLFRYVSKLLRLFRAFILE